MNPAAGAVVAGVLTGAALALSGLRRSRPDPVARALSGHPVRVPQPWGRIDRFLESVTGWAGTAGHGRGQVLGMTPAQQRAVQLRLLAGVAGWGAVLVVSQGPVALLVVLAAVPMVLVGYERILDRQAARLRDTMGDQTLVVSQFVALCLTAGLTTAEALERAAEQVDAPLGPQLQQVTRSVRAGKPLEPALSSVTRLLAVPELDRLTDTLLTGARHGVPLAATLRHQVDDARNRRRTAALERAGRAEIAMLVPVVFLILPAVVAVAVYPGFVALTSL